MSAVAHVVANACQRDVPTLVAPNVLRLLGRLRELGSLQQVATTLGRSHRTLGHELHVAKLPPLRTMFPWIRVLRCSACLHDTTRGLDGLTDMLGYKSVRSLFTAFHRLLGTTPNQVRSEGGLWYASERFRQALAAEQA
jgi:methylphosphotriester-DNA--protein-cysteine methyltransferase